MLPGRKKISGVYRTARMLYQYLVAGVKVEETLVQGWLAGEGLQPSKLWQNHLAEPELRHRLRTKSSRIEGKCSMP